MTNTEKRNTLIFGGDVNLGRWQNAMTPEIGPERVLGTLQVLKEGDFRVVNLESVVSSAGRSGTYKGELVPYYFRGRPEMINILSSAGIDLVSLANNHSGDYGPEALIDMLDLLEKADISYIGAGRNIEEAQIPRIAKIGNVTAGFMAVDFTMKHFSTQIDRAGNYYLNQDDLNDWIEHFEKQIQDIKKNVDLVFLMIHWGANFEKEPSDFLRHAAKLFIEAGIDCILGTSSHILHGVEIIDGKPVIYDAGNFLFDFTSEKKVAGAFKLFLNKKGIEEIQMIPVNRDYCFTTNADAETYRNTLPTFVKRCRNLGTDAKVKENRVCINLPNNVDKNEPEDQKETPSKKVPVRIEPVTEPRKEWLVKEIPDNLDVKEMQFGPIIMHGLKIFSKDYNSYKLLEIESFWSLMDEPVDKDYLIVQRFIPCNETLKKSIWENDHEPCDWQWPTKRWKKGEIYYDRYLLRPVPYEFLAQGMHDFVLGIGQIRTAEGHVEKISNFLNVDCPLPKA